MIDAASRCADHTTRYGIVYTIQFKVIDGSLAAGAGFGQSPSDDVAIDLSAESAHQQIITWQFPNPKVCGGAFDCENFSVGRVRFITVTSLPWVAAQAIGGY